ETWELVVSAPWLEAGKVKATGELVNLLAESIGEESLKRFSRIATLGTDHPIVEFFLKNCPVDDGELHLRSTDLVGLQIDEAIVFRAKASDRVRKGSSTKPLRSAAGDSGHGGR